MAFNSRMPPDATVWTLAPTKLSDHRHHKRTRRLALPTGSARLLSESPRSRLVLLLGLVLDPTAPAETRRPQAPEIGPMRLIGPMRTIPRLSRPPTPPHYPPPAGTYYTIPYHIFTSFHGKPLTLGAITEESFMDHDTTHNHTAASSATFTTTTPHGTAPAAVKPAGMNLVKPFIPTPEEIEFCERRFRRAAGSGPGLASAPVTPAGQAFHPQAQSPHMAALSAAPAPALSQAPAQVQPLRPPPPNLRACLITAAQLEVMQIPRRRCLLDRWLCQGDLGYVFAPRGVGKTWLAMVLPLAISMGRPLGKWKAGERTQTAPGVISPDFEVLPPGTPASQAAAPGRKPVRVLYVDGEMPMELTQQRSRALELSQGSITYLHHETIFENEGTCLNLALPDHRAMLTQTVVEDGYECLILDNLSSLTSGLDENAGIDFDPLSQWLLDFRRRKVTVIIVHHAGRNGLMRGHSKREDACSWILELRDAKTEDDPGAKFTTHFAKPSRNTGDTLPDLLWHFTSTEDGLMEVGCEYANSSEFETFIQHVKDGLQSQGDIAEIMGKPKGTICKWAAKALREGQLSGTPRRLLPPKDKTPATPTKPRAYRDDDDAPAKETSFFDDAVAEYELAQANAEAERLRRMD